MLQELLHVLLVARFGGANKVLVIDIDGLEQRKPRVVHQLVYPGLGLNLVCGCGAKNLLAVLIGSGQQEGILAALSVPTGQNVCSHLGIGVPDVRGIVHIEDRRRCIERRFGAVRHSTILTERAITCLCGHPG